MYGKGILNHSAYRSFKVNDDMTSNNADIIDFNFEKKEIKHKNVENRWRYSVQIRKEKKNGDVRLCTCLRRGSNPRFILRRKLIVNFWSSNVLSLTFHLHLWIMSYWYLLVNCCSSYKLFVLVNLHQRSTNWATETGRRLPVLFLWKKQCYWVAFIVFPVTKFPKILVYI